MKIMNRVPFLSIIHWVFLFFGPSFVKAKNVVMTSSGIAIAANGPGGGGLVLRQSASTSSVQSLPPGISSFDDVSIDAENEALVFALSTTSRRVCSFTLSGDDLSLANCVGNGDNFAVSPFCGVSALDSTLIISGGTGGLTIYQYNPVSGVISTSPRVLNSDLGVIGHPDVVLVNAGLAALSTDFSGGGARFGTQMLSIQGNSVNFGRNFRVQNGLGFSLAQGPANFPLVNAIYETSTSTYMYTANGPMQVQEPLSTNTIDVLSGRPNGFSAVTVAVNTAKKIAVFGGVNASGGSQILFYDLSVDPRNPNLMKSIPITNQRITSIASGGNVAAYVTLELASIRYEQLPVPDGPVACVENGTDEFFLRVNPNNGNAIVKDCDWLIRSANPSLVCNRRVDYSGGFSPAQDICQATCNSCDSCSKW